MKSFPIYRWLKNSHFVWLRMVASMRPAPELRAPKVICHNPRGARGTQRTECGDLVAALWSLQGEKLWKTIWFPAKEMKTNLISWKSSSFWDQVCDLRRFMVPRSTKLYMGGPRIWKNLWNRPWQSETDETCPWSSYPFVGGKVTEEEWTARCVWCSDHSVLIILSKIYTSIYGNVCSEDADELCDFRGSSFKAVVNYQLAPYRCGPPGT